MGLILLGAGLLVAMLAALVYGHLRWRRRTEALFERLDALSAPESDTSPATSPPNQVDFRALEGLPEPVQLYLRQVLRDGQPLIRSVRLQHRGQFNLDNDKAGGRGNWKRFRSHQTTTLQPAGFLWDAQISLLPGLRVAVHDAYIAGEGLLHASLAGLLRLARLQGGGEIAQGELMRYLAEAVWYPTALLPSQGVGWQAVDARSAHATLTDDASSVTLTFHFNAEGLIERVSSPARSRMVGNQMVPTPWVGRFWDYREQGGICVPRCGEVAWTLVEGDKPYWRGELVQIDYQFAPD